MLVWKWQQYPWTISDISWTTAVAGDISSGSIHAPMIGTSLIGRMYVAERVFIVPARTSQYGPHCPALLPDGHGSFWSVGRRLAPVGLSIPLLSRLCTHESTHQGSEAIQACSHLVTKQFTHHFLIETKLYLPLSKGCVPQLLSLSTHLRNIQAFVLSLRRFSITAGFESESFSGRASF